jgi:hypothetical protein
LSASGAAAGGDRRVGLDEFLVEFAELRLIGAQRCGRVGRVGGWCHECGGKQAGGQGAKAERTHSYPRKSVSMAPVSASFPALGKRPGNAFFARAVPIAANRADL